MKFAFAWLPRCLSVRCQFALILFIACTGFAFAQPKGSVGKIEAETWARVEAGEAIDVLVLYQDAAIDTEARSRSVARGLTLQDAATLHSRATRYRQIKARADAALPPDNVQVRRDYRNIPMRLVRPRDAAALARLLARPEVQAVMEDARAYLHLAQSLPLIGQPAVAQGMGRTGAGTTVAVLDTGVDYTRSEFGACLSPGVPAGCRVVAAFDTAPEDNARDVHGHGTWVAGVVAGIAPGAGIAAIDVFDGNSARSSDIIEAIDWAIENQAAYNIVAINLSLGDGVKYSAPCDNRFTNPYRQPLINARAAGILPVVSSGNEGYTNGLANPACTSEAVSVGAVYDANLGALTWTAPEPDCTDSTTMADKVACFSNSASYLTLLAPGALTTVTGATVAGTSLSAPVVAGAVAVLAQAFPNESITTRLGRLTGSGVSITDTRNGIAKPRIHLLAAQGAPFNDGFASAFSLAGSGGQASGWNYNASVETGEPNHTGNAGGKSVWWQWTAPASGSFSLNTHGSGFDTLLALYTGGTVSTLSTLASNDNDGSTGNTSGLNANVSAGSLYRIVVDGKSGASGVVTLNWSLRQAQTIDFSAIGAHSAQTTLSLNAMASSGLPVSYSSGNTGVCIVNGSQATLLKGGTCTLHADQAGDAAWMPAPRSSQSFTVNKLAQAIIFTPIGDQALNAPSFSVSAAASSGLAVHIHTDTPSTCYVDGFQVILTAPGACALRASQVGNEIYEAAQDIVVNFNILATSSELESDGDVPLPLWALLLLGSGLYWLLRHHAEKNNSA